MPKEISRRELFDLVWTKPVTKVAVDFGVSDVAVHKLCKKHRIPVPGRGYWAKRAAGKMVRAVVFREISDGSLNTIRVHGGISTPGPEVVAAREKARADTQAGKAARQLPSPNSAESAPLHLVAQHMKEKLEQARPGADGFVRISDRQSFRTIISSYIAPRLVAFVDLLVKEHERRGCKLVPAEDGLQLEVDGETITAAITEKSNKVPHALTDKEEKANRSWEANRDRTKLRGEYWSDWEKPKPPQWDLVPNGKLSFVIDEGYHSDHLRRRFSDLKGHGIEASIDQIMEALATLSALKKADRAEAERRRKEWAEQEARRHESERRQRLSKKRLEFLEIPLERLEKARKLDAFTADYLSLYRIEEMPESSRALITWAKEYAALLRGSVAPEELSRILDRHRLMDDATDIGSWVSFS
jgi:hypothetical protein